jgi:hypothetical protein
VKAIITILAIKAVAILAEQFSIFFDFILKFNYNPIFIRYCIIMGKILNNVINIKYTKISSIPNIFLIDNYSNTNNKKYWI